MAMIGYPYSAAEQDLWLYDDETIVHSGGTTVVKQPVAWNPGSPLYGYRQSLQGISLRKRYGSSTGTDPTFYTYNDPSDPDNYWAFHNSYPNGFYAVSKKFLFTCRHCFTAATTIVRNPANKWSGTMFPAGNFNDKCSAFKWMNKDNVITDSFDTSEVISPFNTDSSPSLNLASTDLLLTELPSELSFQPLQVVDFLSLSPGATLWYLDGAMKLIRTRLLDARVRRVTPTLSAEKIEVEGRVPDGSAFALTSAYMFDSSSVLLVEVSPPTSAAAGDGVMGLVAGHTSVAGLLSVNHLYGELNPPGYVASFPGPNNARSYMEARGSPMLPLVKAKSQHSDFVLVSQMDRLLERVQNLPVL